MTCIIASGGVMAADGAVFYGEFWKASSQPKIVRLADGSLFGSAGRTSDCRAVRQWMDKPCGPKPSLVEPRAFEALHMRLDGSVWVIDEGLEPWRTSDPEIIGHDSAVVFVRGAMAAGADPGHALRLAIQSGCTVVGGKVQEERLG